MSKQYMSFYWAKESFSSLVDVYVSVLLFDALLKTLGELAYHAKV